MKKLELAQLSDLERINALAKQAEDLHAAWRPDLASSTERAFTEELFHDLQEEKQLYVIRDQGNTVAFVRIRVQPIGSPYDVPVKKVLYLEEICVDEALRHQGIGTKIMDDLKAFCREQGCISICLSVYPENEAARAFYEKRGFGVSSINMRMKV